MGTRGAIARTNDERKTFTGVYHHWDSYPTALGETLFELCRDTFDGDVDNMLKVLIDEHPAGWSTINDKDWDKPIGYDEDGPNCYCHGSRSEEPQKITERNASGCGCEYVYAFVDDTMYILSSYCQDGGKMIGMFGMGDDDATWRIIATVDLKGDEPDWKKIESDEDDDN